MSSSPPHAEAQARPAALGDLRSAPVAAMPSTMWVVPAVGLLTVALFGASSVEVMGVLSSSVTKWVLVAWFGFSLITILSLPPALPFHVKSPVARAMVAFVAALVASTLLVYTGGLRTDTGKLLPQVAAVLIMTLPFFVLEAAAKRTSAERCVLWTCHVMFLLSAASVLGDFTGLTHYESAQSRYFGFLGDGVAWALTLPLLVYFCSRRLVLAAICLILLGLTGSRAPALCAAAGILFLIAFGRGGRAQYTLLLAGLAAVALYYSHLFTTVVQRLSTTHLAANDRVSTAALGLRVFERSPLFGSGYNAQAYYFPETFRRLQLGQFQVQTSTFVQMLGEGGLLQFAAYMAFVITATIGAVVVIKRSRLVTSTGVINGVAVWLLTTLWVNQSAAWFLVGSYMGPLTFGMAGIVSGYYAHLRLAPRHEQPGRVPG